MSQRNVALARLTVEALNRHDLDAILPLMDEQVVGVPLVAAVDGGYHGIEGIRDWARNLFATFPDFELEIHEVRDLGDRTLSHLFLKGRGADSDTPFEIELWYLTEWREEKALSWHAYRTEAEALEAAE